MFRVTTSPRQDNVDAGFVFSEAAVTAWTTSPNPTQVASKVDVSNPLIQRPQIRIDKRLIAITKEAGIDPTYSDKDDTATFEVYINNTGNTRLIEVALLDDMFDEGNIACNPNISGTTSGVLPLLPDGSIACEAVLQLTFIDVDAGHIAGTAEVDGAQPPTSSSFNCYRRPITISSTPILFRQSLHTLSSAFAAWRPSKRRIESKANARNFLNEKLMLCSSKK